MNFITQFNQANIRTNHLDMSKRFILEVSSGSTRCDNCPFIKNENVCQYLNENNLCAEYNFCSANLEDVEELSD